VPGVYHPCDSPGSRRGLNVMCLGTSVEAAAVACQLVANVVCLWCAWGGVPGVVCPGERLQAHRILRSTKNRYGTTDELAVFEMASTGLAAVPDPSAIFLSSRHHSGSPAGPPPSQSSCRAPAPCCRRSRPCATRQGSPREAVQQWGGEPAACSPPRCAAEGARGSRPTRRWVLASSTVMYCTVMNCTLFAVVCCCTVHLSTVQYSISFQSRTYSSTWWEASR